MLKLTYTSTGVTLERSVESFEVALRQRVLLGLRLGEPVSLEPTVITLRVSRSLPGLQGLMGTIAHVPHHPVQVMDKETTQVEMQLQGYWLAQPEPPGEGIFFLNADPVLEGHLIEIWQASHQDVSCCP